MIRALLTLALFTVSQLSAHAFLVSDHGKLTKIAAQEFSTCFPGHLTSNDIESMVTANEGEDFALWKKFFRHSHYFHPEKTPGTIIRKSAYEIIQLLDQRLRKIDPNDKSMREEFFYDLGSAMHFIQDLASPSHVTLVRHTFLDGFESFPVSDEVPPRFATPDDACTELRSVRFDGAKSIFERIAKTTLELVRNRTFDGYALNETDATPEWLPVKLNLNIFWQESHQNRFGSYGKLGNAFGQTHFTLNNTRYRVSLQTYENLKKEQMRAAVDATKHLLTRYLILQPRWF